MQSQTTPSIPAYSECRVEASSTPVPFTPIVGVSPSISANKSAAVDVDPQQPPAFSLVPSVSVPVSHIHPSYAPTTSNAHAARLMHDSKWRRENTSAGGASFVEGFFKRSRLHYLSTWKSELKLLVKNAKMRAEEGSSGVVNPSSSGTHGHGAHSMRGDELVIGRTSPLKSKPTVSSRSNSNQSTTSSIGSKAHFSATKRVFMHCDFDCFFVSAGLVTRPHLKGLPVVVCHAGNARTDAGGDEGEGASITKVPKVESTSEIASASYEARRFGVKNGMRQVVLVSREACFSDNMLAG